MRKFLAYSTTGFVLLTAAAFAQSSQPDETKAQDFFKNHVRQSAEDYVSSRIEQYYQTDSAILKLILPISMATTQNTQFSPCNRFTTI